MPNFEFPNSYPESSSKFNFPSKSIEQLNSLIASEAKKAVQTSSFVVSDLIRRVKTPERSIDVNGKSPNISDTKFDFSNKDKSQFSFIKERIKNITFLPTNYINEQGQNVQTPQIDLELCLMDLDFANNEVETQILNQTGTIKEIVSQGDYQIQISGAIIGNFTAPTSQDPLSGKDKKTIRDLITLAKSKISVKIVSDYLGLADVKKLLIKSISLPQQSNHWNIQNFSLVCVSDDDDLYIL
jgi:hypothetical protein